MNRFILLLLLAVINLIGRENPFLSTKEAEEDIPISNNYIQAPGDLKKITFTLPNSARILESLEIRYINIDGSIGKKKIEINKKFNWNKKLAFGYNYIQPKQEQAKKNTIVITKTVKRRVSRVVENRVVYNKGQNLNEQKVDKSKLKDEVTVTHYVNGKPEHETDENSNVEFGETNADRLERLKKEGELQAKEKAVQKNSSSIYKKSSVWGDGFSQNSTTQKSINNFEDNELSEEDDYQSGSRVTISIGKPKFIEFDFNIETSKIKISTADKKHRHYMLIRPNRIVIDFEREIKFQNQTFEIAKGIFKKMKISKKGSSRYRITIYIEDDYRYKLNRTEEGYNIECYKR